MAITQSWSTPARSVPGTGAAGRALVPREAEVAISATPIEPGYKRVLDQGVAGVGLLLLLPWMAILCVLIKLTSPGPAFHLQERVGRGGKTFRIIKLRSMVDGAEQTSGPVWASENDPRITPLGRFLRTSHLDEMPQLVNVLLGQMSLVGPRPERPVFVERFKAHFPDYGRRLAIKPGITGLAQVHYHYGSTIEDVRTKLAFDLRYIETMSFRTDLRILLLTGRRLTGRGAR